MARNVNASYESADNKRTPVISTWTRGSGTLKTSYVSGTNNNATFHTNANIKMATVSFNLNLHTLPPANTVIVSGLPKTSIVHYVAFANGTNASMRGYISLNGDLVIDVAPTTTGWYAGSTTYPYASL